MFRKTSVPFWHPRLQQSPPVTQCSNCSWTRLRARADAALWNASPRKLSRYLLELMNAQTLSVQAMPAYPRVSQRAGR